MTDISKLSDAELQALYAAPVANPAASMSDAELKAAYGATARETAVDVAKSAGVGIGKGVIGLAGMVGDLTDLGAKGLEAADKYISGKIGIEPYKPPMDRSKSILNNIPTAAVIQKAVEDNVTGEFYKPQTIAGKYAHTAGEFLPAAAAGPGSAVSRVAAAMASGVGSEAAGQLTEGTAAEPYARVVGAVAGGLAPAAAGRAITPLPVNPARQRLVEILNNEGVTSLTAGQRTGNKSLQYAESFLGDGPLAGQGASRIQQEGQRQFTEAAMRRAGGGADASPEVLAGNSQRLGDQFRDLSARNTLTPDNQFVTDVVAAARNYRRVPDSQQRQMVQGYIDDIVGHVNAGAMPGPQYQEMRSRLSKQANSLRESDPTLSEALRDMRNALDNAMERSIPANSPDAALWRQTRREYGAQRVIEKAASRAGEATAEGQLVPANLRNTVAAENRGAYARGQGDFSELTRAGAGVMAPLPNSGTAQRNALTNLLMLPVSATAGRVITSRPVQAYLGNQVLTEQLANMSPGRVNVLRALLTQQPRPQLEAQPR